jgi:hypothetical protein
LPVGTVTPAAGAPVAGVGSLAAVPTEAEALVADPMEAVEAEVAEALVAAPTEAVEVPVAVQGAEAPPVAGAAIASAKKYVCKWRPACDRVESLIFTLLWLMRTYDTGCSGRCWFFCWS